MNRNTKEPTVNQATATALTLDAIENAAAHESHGDECEGWQGFGYIGERSRRLDTIWTAIAAAKRGVEPDVTVDDPAAALAAVALSDQAVLDYANQAGWSEHRLFDWLNSRDGRHFADQALYSADGIRLALNWRLLPGTLGRPFSR
jgi:hypothetical protein